MLWWCEDGQLLQWASKGSLSCSMLFHCIFEICGYNSLYILGRDMILSFYLLWIDIICIGYYVCMSNVMDFLFPM